MVVDVVSINGGTTAVTLIPFTLARLLVALLFGWLASELAASAASEAGVLSLLRCLATWQSDRFDLAYFDSSPAEVPTAPFATSMVGGVATGGTAGSTQCELTSFNCLACTANMDSARSKAAARPKATAIFWPHKWSMDYAAALTRPVSC